MVRRRITLVAGIVVGAVCGVPPVLADGPAVREQQLTSASPYLGPSSAREYASAERRQAAMGHYARARAMLVEALAEFEQGRRVARPDLLVDPGKWRSSVIERADELDRLLDPQPRVTKGGARFKENALLIRKEKQAIKAKPAKQSPAVDLSAGEKKLIEPPVVEHSQVGAGAANIDRIVRDQINRAMEEAPPPPPTETPVEAQVIQVPAGLPPAAQIPEQSAVGAPAPAPTPLDLTAPAGADESEIRARLQKLGQEIAAEERKKADAEQGQ